MQCDQVEDRLAEIVRKLSVADKQRGSRLDDVFQTCDGLNEGAVIVERSRKVIAMTVNSTSVTADELVEQP